jgi:cobalt-zinc-cadmium efflux system outer membrane protein
MCSQTKVIVWLSTLVVVAGCATVNPRPDYERAAREVSQAVGHESVYQPGDEEIVARKVTELLDGGITANEASQLCLLNNPRLQAAFMDVGVARAELVQSGLLSNPTLGMSLELPEGGGRSNIQASIAQNIADLWQIPVRQSGAERKLDEAILKLAREATELARTPRQRTTPPWVRIKP